MRHTIICICSGFLPLLVGFLLNYLLGIRQVPLFLINVIFIVVWAFLAGRLYRHDGAMLKTIVMMDLPNAVCLFLLAYQTLIVKAFSSNFVIGALPQLYYLPVLTVGFWLTTFWNNMFAGFLASFCILIAAAAAGCLLSGEHPHDK